MTTTGLSTSQKKALKIVSRPSIELSALLLAVLEEFQPEDRERILARAEELTETVLSY